MKRTAAVLLVLALASACTTSPAPGPSGPAVVAVGDDVPVLTVDRDHDVVANAVTQVDGRAATLQGWTADGTEVYVRHAHRADGDPKDDDPYAVALVARDPKSGRTTVLSDRAARQGPIDRGRIPGNALQIVSVRVDGEAIVWIETPSSTHGDLYVHDVGTGVERRLVRASASAVSTPVVLQDHVYFVGIDGDDLDATPARTSLYRVPLDGSAAAELVAPGAVDVHLDGDPVIHRADDRLVVVRDDRVVQWDPRRGADGEIADSGLPADCGAAAGEDVTLVCDDQDLTIVTDDGRFEIHDVPGRVGGLWANRGWVAFTSDVGGEQVQYVFDVRREVLRRVPSSRVLRGLHTGASFLGVLGSTSPAPTEPVIELVS